MKILLLTLCLCLMLGLSHGEICETCLKVLSEAEKQFTQCASDYAVPVKICLNCNNWHHKLSEAYKNLTKSIDPKTNSTCKDLYFNKDRLNIIQRIYTELDGLWEKAFCSECYTNLNETQEILGNITEFQFCIKARRDPCTFCKSSYLKINDMYDNRSKRFNGQICFDIQDMMNRSRVTWSKELKCCKREPKLFDFSILSSALLLLPVLFYGGLVIFRIRTERNHGILDNDGDNSETAERSSSRNDISENGSNTIVNSQTNSTIQRRLSNNSEHRKRSLSDIESNDDDDEALLPKRN